MQTCNYCGKDIPEGCACFCKKPTSTAGNNVFDPSHELILMYEKLAKIESDFKEANERMDQISNAVLAQSKAILTTMDSITLICEAVDLLNQSKIKEIEK